MRRKRYNSKQIEFAEIMLSTLTAKKVSDLLKLPFTTCKNLKRKKETKIKKTRKVRLSTYGTRTRLLFSYEQGKHPILDIFLFANVYPSDVVRCLEEHTKILKDEYV